MFAIGVGIAVIFALIRMALSWSERYTLAAARQSADCFGTVRRVGAVTFWWSGPDDPLPMVQEQMEVAQIGRVGYVMGADVLIDLLRSADIYLSQEIVWSLQAVSGQGWGHDVDRWQAWVESVPAVALRGEQ